MPNQTMVCSCSGAEQEYTMVWFGIFLYLLISSLKIRFCEQSVFAKSPLPPFWEILMKYWPFWCNIDHKIKNIDHLSKIDNYLPQWLKNRPYGCPEIVFFAEESLCSIVTVFILCNGDAEEESPGWGTQ